MTSRVTQYCDFCGDQVPGPSEDQVVVMIGYQSYASRQDFHNAHACENCLKTRNVALELVEMERADRAKADADAGAVSVPDLVP